MNEDVRDKSYQERPGARRVRREDARRQEPIRNWWNLFRQPDRGRSARASAPAGNGNGKQERTVDRGVRLGYELLEEQIQQGQRVAQEINNRSYGVDSMNRDFQELAVRSMRYYIDAASLFMDFFATIPQNLAPTSAPGQGTARPAANGAKGGSAATASGHENGSVPVATRVLSKMPTTVTVDLKPGRARSPLRIGGLHATENGAPPITAVAYSPSGEGGRPFLEIEVPEEQTAGLYAGVLIDPQTGEPAGTVSLRLGS